jgi:hypothetical protein
MNRILAIFLLLVLMVWTAAQFGDAWFLYLLIVPPDGVQHPCDLGCWVKRGGVKLAAAGQSGVYSLRRHTVYSGVRLCKKPWEDRFARPGMSMQERSVFVPYWLAAFTPAMLLAWRWWRWSRQRRMRGFEVGPAE